MIEILAVWNGSRSGDLNNHKLLEKCGVTLLALFRVQVLRIYSFAAPVSLFIILARARPCVWGHQASEQVTCGAATSGGREGQKRKAWAGRCHHIIGLRRYPAGPLRAGQ